MSLSTNSGRKDAGAKAKVRATTKVARRTPLSDHVETTKQMMWVNIGGWKLLLHSCMNNSLSITAFSPYPYTSKVDYADIQINEAGVESSVHSCAPEGYGQAEWDVLDEAERSIARDVIAKQQAAGVTDKDGEDEVDAAIHEADEKMGPGFGYTDKKGGSY
jgi:hypothetical protein